MNPIEKNIITFLGSFLFVGDIDNNMSSIVTVFTSR